MYATSVHAVLDLACTFQSHLMISILRMYILIFETTNKFHNVILFAKSYHIIVTLCFLNHVVNTSVTQSSR